jgi:SAM-dependent methyltransferase
MDLDARFDDLVASLAGFHSAWLVYLGLELGLFAELRRSGDHGLTTAALANATGCRAEAIETWAWAADAHGLATLRDDRLTLDEDTAIVLLDDQRPEYLGGQFVHSVIASLDWGGMLQYFRDGTTIGERPDRYRTSIERLTVQDVAVFFQEVLAAFPQLAADLTRGGRVVDIHCGGGRWLIAMARRFGSLQLLGVEAETDSVARARANVAEAGLTDRIEIHEAPVTALDGGPYALAYFQYALHQLKDPPGALAAAWRALAPGGRIVVLDWPLPATPDEFRTRHGELIAGVQLDELYQGTALVTRDGFRAWFAAAGLPEPTLVDLPSGATAVVLERPTA